MPRYQKVLWHHNYPDEPVMLYSEIDSGFEIRKIEVYRDGRRDYADRSHSTGTTMLGEKMIPGMDEIRGDPDFSAVAIAAEEFEEMWRRATEVGRDGAGQPDIPLRISFEISNIDQTASRMDMEF